MTPAGPGLDPAGHYGLLQGRIGSTWTMLRKNNFRFSSTELTMSLSTGNREVCLRMKLFTLSHVGTAGLSDWLDELLVSNNKVHFMLK